ncbi:MAG: lysylphosphatidylglycerol synthase transmembrane domain-containing protein [Anaerolineae bacterium]
MKKYLGTILRITITVAGLVWAINGIDFQALWAILQEANWGWVFAGFFLVFMSMPLRAWRWWVLLKGLGVQNIKFGQLVQLYYVGSFFNAFLPSGFGGDVVRVVEVAQEIPADIASGTVFLDRFTGLLLLFVIGLIGLPFLPESFPSTWALAIAIVCLLGLIAGVILIDGRLVRLIGNSAVGQLLPKIVSPVGTGPLAKFLAAVQGCGQKAVFQALGISALFDIVLVGWWSCAAYSLGHSISFFYNLVVVPVFAVALMIPSVGGLGPREMLAPSLYSGAGLGTEASVAITLIVYLMLRMSSLTGGLVYVYRIIVEGKKATQLANEEG